MKLSDERRILIGRTMAVATVVLSIAGLVIIPTLSDLDMLVETGAITFGVFGIGLGVLTWVLVSAQPQNGAVWVIAWTSVFAALQVGGHAAIVVWSRDLYPGLTFETLHALSPSQLPLPAAIGLSVTGWSITPAIWLPLTLGLLLFPDGHPPSPRWRWVGWWSILAITTSAVASGIVQNPRSDLPISTFGGTLPGVIGQIQEMAFVLAALSSVVSVASLVVRYRRSTGEVRSQIGWIGWGGALYIVGFWVGASFLESAVTVSPLTNQLVFIGLQSVLLVSYGVAITKYRLYDIDVVIARTVAYTVLAGFITGVYALLVVVIGSFIGVGDDQNLALSIVAVAVVAVAFEPLRNRVQGWANRLVYGERATPYEVLARATHRFADTAAPQDAIAEVIQLLADGTGASEAVLWVKTGDRLIPYAASQSTTVDRLEPIPLASGRGPEVPGDAQAPVLHRGERLGIVSITERRGQTVSTADERLLDDVAAGLGLLLRNVSLNTELAERAERLRSSRRRLVEAHDSVRHRLERDLHDGAQQQVVALKVKLGIARTLAGREGAERVAQIVESLAEDTQSAVDGMRAVAHGIYPPLLESEGLASALTALTRSVTTPVVFNADSPGRYDRSLEETIYFCVLEAVNRAVDAGATTIAVSLVEAEDALEFTVRFDATLSDLPVVEDRVDAFSGSMNLVKDGDGTTLTGHIPVVDALVTLS